MSVSTFVSFNHFSLLRNDSILVDSPSPPFLSSLIVCLCMCDCAKVVLIQHHDLRFIFRISFGVKDQKRFSGHTAQVCGMWQPISRHFTHTPDPSQGKCCVYRQQMPLSTQRWPTFMIRRKENISFFVRILGLSSHKIAFILNWPNQSVASACTVVHLNRNTVSPNCKIEMVLSSTKSICDEFFSWCR